MICGGTMFGNCAIGSACIDTSPARTVTIAMTMATIGRRTKNAAMAYRPSAGFGCASPRAGPALDDAAPGALAPDAVDAGAGDPDEVAAPAPSGCTPLRDDATASGGS